MCEAIDASLVHWETQIKKNDLKKKSNKRKYQTPISVTKVSNSHQSQIVCIRISYQAIEFARKNSDTLHIFLIHFVQNSKRKKKKPIKINYILEATE